MAHGAWGRAAQGARGGGMRGAGRGPGALAGTTAARPRPRPKSNFLIYQQYTQYKCRSKLSAKNSNYGVSYPRWLALPAEPPGVLGVRVAAPRVTPRTRQIWSAKASPQDHPARRRMCPGDMELGAWGAAASLEEAASWYGEERALRWVFSRYHPTCPACERERGRCRLLAALRRTCVRVGLGSHPG